MIGKYKYFIIIGVLILALGGGAYYFLSANKASEKSAVQAEPTLEVIPTINPEDLGLVLTARSDKKAVKFEITNIKNISTIDYELTYLAQGNIPRGTIGHIEVNSGDSKVETKYLDLGSCSSGKCKYDEGVTSVKLILKITKSDGSVYSSEKTLEL